MLEYPEVITLAKQIHQEITGKQVSRVYPPVKAHKFCWFAGDPAEYDAKLRGSTVQWVEGFGSYVELILDQGKRLCFHDGVTVRLVDAADAPKTYQLLIEFTDKTALVFTVMMYGGLILQEGTYENPYYQKSREAISPFADEFVPYYYQQLSGSKPSLSAKAFLATEQRFPGIGNGVLQDILLAAGIHPKRKIGSLDQQEQRKLLEAIRLVLGQMYNGGGRDTEKTLYGQQGGYQTKLSKNTLGKGCPHCKGPIVKEAYLGGAVYFCPICQPLQ